METKSPQMKQALECIKASDKPIGFREVAERTHMKPEQAKQQVKNLLRRGLIKNATPGKSPTVYKAVVDYSAKAVISAPSLENEAWRHVLPKRVGLTGRSANVGPNRLKVEAFLEAAEKPYTRAEIAKAVKVDETSLGHVINDMIMRGTLWNVTQVKNKANSYILSSKREKKPAKEPRFVPTEVYQWSYAQPARPGAADHESIPSRRANGLVKHQPMMLMASKVRGGESAR